MIPFLQDIVEVYLLPGTEQLVSFRILRSPPILERVDQQLGRFPVEQIHFPLMIKRHCLKNLRGYDFFFEELETGALQAAAQLTHLVFPTEVGNKKMPVRAEDPIYFLQEKV